MSLCFSSFLFVCLFFLESVFSFRFCVFVVLFCSFFFGWREVFAFHMEFFFFKKKKLVPFNFLLIFIVINIFMIMIMKVNCG